MRPFIPGDALLFASLCLPLMAQVSPVALSDSKDVVPAFSASGAITLPAAHLQLDVSYTSGKKERRDLVVVYDPQNGYYWWQLAAFPAPADGGGFIEAIKSQKRIVHANADGIVEFVFRSDLWVKVYTSRADSLDAAAGAVMKEVQQGLASLERGYQPRTGPALQRWPWDYKPVDLRGAVPLEFSCFPVRANCADDLTTIVSVVKQGGNWRLVLRNRWDQEVILDQNFSFLSTQQLTQPKQ